MPKGIFFNFTAVYIRAMECYIVLNPMPMDAKLLCDKLLVFLTEFYLLGLGIHNCSLFHPDAEVVGVNDIGAIAVLDSINKLLHKNSL